MQRNFWGIAIPRFLADPMWGTLAFWLPLYLNKVRGWDLKHIALFAWLPFLAADLGCIFGGLVSADLQKHAGISVVNARRAAFTLGACLMTSVAFAGRVQSPYTAILLFSVAGFAHQTLSVTVITMASDLFRRSEVATVAGMAGTLGNAGLLTFSLLIGVAGGEDRLFAVLRVPEHPGHHRRGRPVDARARASRAPGRRIPRHRTGGGAGRRSPLSSAQPTGA